LDSDTYMFDQLNRLKWREKTIRSFKYLIKYKKNTLYIIRCHIDW